MNFRKVILYFLLAIPISIRAQDGSLSIILGQNDNFISIDKSKIKIQSYKYTSNFYNFSIDVPSEFQHVLNKNLPDGCIFSNSDNNSDYGFWVSHYATMRYSKSACLEITKNPKKVRSYYREIIFKNGVLADSKFLSDTVRIIKVSGIPAIQYTCSFIKKNGSDEFNGQMVLTQVFYKTFNYRIISIVKNESKFIIADSFLINKLIESFKLLKTNE